VQVATARVLSVVLLPIRSYFDTTISVSGIRRVFHGFVKKIGIAWLALHGDLILVFI